MSKRYSLKQFLLRKALPGQVTILVLLSVVLVALFFFYSRPQIELRHQQNIDAINAAVESSIAETVSQLKNLASNDFVVNSLVEPEQQQYYLPLFFQSLQINNDESAAIAFFDFEANVIASKNIEPLEKVLPSYQWQQRVLQQGEDVIDIASYGVLIAVPVYFSQDFVEGAIVFYSSSLARLVEYQGQSASQLITDPAGIVLLSTSGTAFDADQRIMPGELDGFFVKQRSIDGLEYYSFESFAEAYTAVLYLLPFIVLTLLSAFIASLFSTQLTARMGSVTLRRFSEQIKSGFSDGENLKRDMHVEHIQELKDIEEAFDGLKSQIDELSLSNDKVNNVINALLEFMVVADNSGKIILLNDACEQFMQSVDLSGYDLLELLDDLSKNENAESISNTERRYQQPNSEEPRVIHWYVTPLLDNQGRTSGQVLVGEDLTLRRSLESALLLKTQAVDRASTSILIADISQPGEPIIYINEACVALTGYSRDDFIGKNCRFLQGPETNKDDVVAIREAINHRQPIDVTLLNYRKDGSEFYNQLTLTPIQNDDGSVTHYIGIQQDVTAREQTAQYLEKAKLKAEESSRMKADFLANMSHEIRTPINGIYGVLQLLRDSRLNNKQNEFVDLALTSTRNLLHIINDILDLSKIDAGKLAIERIFFDPVEFITEISESYRLQCAAKGLAYGDKIQVPDNALIKNDPTRIRQVIENLMSNALKFTEQGSIRVVFKVETKEDAGQLTVVIKDSGIGIAEEKLESIFDQFSQEDLSTTREFGGTGLGLSISQQLCRLMGGDIRVNSAKGQGSQFTITLPIDIIISDSAPAPESLSGEVDLATANKGKLSILLVEDNEINQAVAEHQLADHKVTIAGNGQIALDVIEMSESEFDLVLMDCQMPVMDGFEASRQIRAGVAGEQAKALPIIALTANAMKGDRELCIEAGMDDYISKPFEAAELLRKVQYWANQRTNYQI